MKVRLTEEQYNKLIKEQTRFDFPIHGIPDSHKQSYRDYQKNRRSGYDMDTIQGVLDWAGMIPIYGDAIDAFNAVIYFTRGKNIEGALSVIAIIPVVGSVVAIPFKLLFRLLGKVSAGLMLDGIGLILKGRGEMFVEPFIEASRKYAPEQLKKVLNIVKQKIDKIVEGLDIINAPFVKMDEFNHYLVPNFMLGKINSLGKKGKAALKGFKNFFLGLSEAEAEKQTKKSLTQQRFEEPTKEKGFIEKNIMEPRRVAKMNKTEKSIFNYIKGYNKKDKRLKPYTYPFRNYYRDYISGKRAGDQSLLTDDEILRFLSKHYHEDISPNLTGLYKNKILTHGSTDIMGLNVIDIGTHLGKNTHNKGLLGSGFYLTASPKTGKHYGDIQPFVINNVNNPLYLRKGTKNYYGYHDYEGYQLTAFFNHEKLHKTLDKESIDLIDKYSRSHIGGDRPFFRVASASPELDPAWKQNITKVIKKEFKENLKKAGLDDLSINKALKTIDNKIQVEPEYISIAGDSPMMIDLMKRKKHDLIVSSINTASSGPSGAFNTGGDTFMDAEVIVKQDKAKDVISLFPSIESITKLGDEGGSITRNLGSSNIHHESHKRKIKLTESQHRRMVKEDARHAVLADKLRQELAGADLKRTMHDLTTLYAYTEEEIIDSPVLMKLVMDKLLKEIRESYYISRELKDKYANYFDAVGLAAAKEIMNSNINPYSKFLQLDGIAETIPYRHTHSMDTNREVVTEIRDGLVYDTLQYLFDNFSPRDALKRASIMVNRRMVDYEEMYPLVKQFADEHGITLFSKYHGLTFAKKDGMMRSLVNYLKDVEPKTKEGFLDYINSVGRGPGQHTVFWGAAKNAGLLVPVRNGRKITYKLGPNYEAWENDKLVAF